MKKLLSATAFAAALLSRAALATQATLVVPGAPLPMSGLASFLDSALLSIGSCNGGPSAPANGTGGAAFAGECWVNTTGNPWVFSYTADGTHWTEFGALNTASFVWLPYSNGFSTSLGGNFSTAGAVAHVGAYATTITATGVTNSTLPAGTHTLAGLDVNQAFTGTDNFTGVFEIGGYQATLGGAFSTAGIFSTAGAFTQVGAYATTLTVTGITNATLPAGTHTLAGLDVSQTFSGNDTFSGTVNHTGPFQISGTAETFPASGNLVGTTDTQTLTGKTFNCANNTCTVRLAYDVTGNLPLTNIATGTQDTILGYFASTSVGAGALTNCSNALTYSTSTHTFGCNVSAGTGTVTEQKNTASGGLVTSGNCDNTSSNATSPCNYALTSGRQTLPTHQVFLSGSGTYTTPANALWIEVRLVGGGAGGGGGNNATAGTSGGGSCWNTSGSACTSPVYEAGGGTGGTNSATVAGAGGAISGSSSCDWSVGGSSGVLGGISVTSTFGAVSGKGGDSTLGGGGTGIYGNSSGGSATTNSGSGGGGGGMSAGASAQSGSGGGAGATCHVVINNPASSYTYAVGAGGAGAAAGSSGGAGGAGAAGQIVVYEHYGS